MKVYSNFKVRGLAARYKPAHPNCDFSQPGELYRKVMKDQDRSNLISNLVGAIKGANLEIQERQVKIFYKCDPEYGTRVAEGLNIPVNRMKL